MEIETDRLIITPFTNEWISIVQKQGYENGPEIANHIIALEKDSSMLYWGSWLIVRKSDAAIIGDIGFKGKPNTQKQVEIGYGLLDQYCQQGYATESVDALIKWIFTEQDVEKVVAETQFGNAKSARVLEKVNMKITQETKSMLYWAICKNVWEQ